MSKRITKKTFEAITPGSLIRVRWPDASAGATDDGSIQEILDDHDPVVYDTVGFFIGVAKGDVVLTSDQRVDRDEYRGTLNIPKKWIIEIQLINFSKEEKEMKNVSCGSSNKKICNKRQLNKSR
jgi:hypothetical protein